MSGSSPRMRGAPPDLAVEVHGYGIIPAYAGSTLYRGSVLQRDRDHPRVCGEHVSATKPSVSALGSSPRMRGAQRAWLPVNHRVGIIPAYAGSTSPTRRRAAAARDHPRVCGEHITNQATCGSGQGSSPRMRGAPLALCGRREGDGIIPAYAGSTDGHGFVWAARRDHPRVCGEHPTATVSECVERGSSPRMRGALLGELGGHVAARIIPAYAGSTRPPVRRWLRCGDHPRVCGEHSFSSFSQLSW